MSNTIQNNTTKLQDLLTQVNALPEALDTSDATATASDMAEGVTAYVNGEKITGNVPVTPSEYSYMVMGAELGASDTTVSLSCPVNEGRLLREGSEIYLSTYLSNFGNATAADVAAGKTFTSVDGLLVTGTASSCGVNFQYGVIDNGTTENGQDGTLEIDGSRMRIFIPFPEGIANSKFIAISICGTTYNSAGDGIGHFSAGGIMNNLDGANTNHYFAGTHSFMYETDDGIESYQYDEEECEFYNEERSCFEFAVGRSSDGLIADTWFAFYYWYL